MSSPGSALEAGEGPLGESDSLRLPETLIGLRDRRVDVVGVASVEGGEIARFLISAGFTQVVGHDLKESLEELGSAHHLAHAGLPAEERQARLGRLLGGLAQLHLGRDYLDGVRDSALVIPTQAWFLQPRNGLLADLRRDGHPFYSLIQAYLDLARGVVVGVTGSHGKSTTSSLVAAALRRTRRFGEVWLAGNERHNRQALEAVARDTSGQGCLVLEISNRQLLQMDRAPEVAAITNITPNHLEEHQGMAGYIACKRRIVDLPGCRLAVRNADDPVSMGTGALAPKVLELRFAREEEGLGGLDGTFQSDGAIHLRWRGERRRVLEVDHLRLRGEHNLANVRAAIAICASVRGLDPAALPAISAGIERFGTLPHRIQLVWQEDGVDYYDDLSSTTPQSTVAAIRTVGRSVILIAGGQDKGIDFADLAAEVGSAVTAVVLLPGTGSARLLEAIRSKGEISRVSQVGNLEEAVRDARRLARPNQAILLSPACPGFFSAHYQRGGFRQAVRRLSTSPRPQRAPA